MNCFYHAEKSALDKSVSHSFYYEFNLTPDICGLDWIGSGKWTRV